MSSWLCFLGTKEVRKCKGFRRLNKYYLACPTLRVRITTLPLFLAMSCYQIQRLAEQKAESRKQKARCNQSNQRTIRWTCCIRFLYWILYIRIPGLCYLFNFYLQVHAFVRKDSTSRTSIQKAIEGATNDSECRELFASLQYLQKRLRNKCKLLNISSVHEFSPIYITDTQQSKKCANCQGPADSEGMCCSEFPCDEWRRRTCEVCEQFVCEETGDYLTLLFCEPCDEPLCSYCVQQCQNCGAKCCSGCCAENESRICRKIFDKKCTVRSIRV